MNDNVRSPRENRGQTPRFFSRSQHTLHEVLLDESLVAVRVAQGAGDIAEVRERVTAALPQNSQETRRRYADSLIRWFFRDGVASFAPTAWGRFQNVPIQIILHRYLYLTEEPIMGACVAEVLCHLGEGVIVPEDYLAAATAKFIGHELSPQTKKRLRANLRKLGFLERSGVGDRVTVPGVNQTALLLALHHAFAGDHPRSVEFDTLAANPFWRFVGIRTEDHLRDALKAAVHAGLLGKYVVADRLEQVTTRFTLPELLAKGVAS